MEGKLFYVGSTHEFLIWANGQPDCVNANEYCVALQGQTQMDDRPCGDSYPFLCYNAKNTSYILVMESRSWSAAQSYCRTYHTDLTSIRSKEEKSNTTLTLNGSADMHSTEIQQQVSQQLSGLMLSEGLTDFRTRWRKVQSYRDDQSKKEDGDGGCKTED
ncbi:unnamed protein product [Oreochromis niloticus]|nr:unnamed protein product [Mustela putorius furo]